MDIREATEADLSKVLFVEQAAFGHEEEANLVKDLLSDASANPSLSLLAFADNQAIGHILFTAARLQGTQSDVSISLLAPLAVLPDYQRQGVGGQLIKEGLARLSAAHVDLVFVLGHPDYYPRYGFNPAGVQGFQAPYPIPKQDAGAWMVQELSAGAIDSVSGTIQCAKMLDKAEYWRE